jgi:hypothetical protein
MSQAGSTSGGGGDLSSLVINTNSGTASPIANVLNVYGGTGITTSATLNTVTITATNSGGIQTLTGNTGGAISPSGGNINTFGAGSISISGTGSTLTTQLTGLTQYNVLAGVSSNTITSISPSTAGIPLISEGASMYPAFGTALVVGGGTGSSTFNINGPVISGTTTTSPLTALTLTSGQVVIGGTSTPAAATLSAGNGISITNGNNSITISSPGGGFTWSDESTSFAASAGNGYFVTATSTATLTSSPSQGNSIAFVVDSASGILTIQANTGQFIQLGTAKSASAGVCVSNKNGDSIVLVYRASDSIWFGIQSVGTWSIT